MHQKLLLSKGKEHFFLGKIFLNHLKYLRDLLLVNWLLDCKIWGFYFVFRAKVFSAILLVMIFDTLPKLYRLTWGNNFSIPH